MQRSVIERCSKLRPINPNYDKVLSARVEGDDLIVEIKNEKKVEEIIINKGVNKGVDYCFQVITEYVGYPEQEEQKKQTKKMLKNYKQIEGHKKVKKVVKTKKKGK
jgi:hypothetical protein